MAVGVGGVMPSKSIGRSLIPFDRTAPMATAEHRVSPTPCGGVRQTSTYQLFNSFRATISESEIPVA